ncbi:MAG: hypothetical protein Q9157_001156 [Trypethelium eluteriae]
MGSTIERRGSKRQTLVHAGSGGSGQTVGTHAWTHGMVERVDGTIGAVNDLELDLPGGTLEAAEVSQSQSASQHQSQSQCQNQTLIRTRAASAA